MQKSKQVQKVKKQTPFVIVGMIAVLTAMLLLLWFNTSNSQQSVLATHLDIQFEGQYRIGDGDWQPVEKGKHISSTQGDVTLKGQFHMVSPAGEHFGAAGAGTSLAFYMNHIHITVQEQGQEAFVFDIESDYAGKDLCGQCCTGYTLVSDEPVTLTFHNYHRFGNENAIDDFLQELSIYADSAYEKDFMAQGTTERNAGLIFVIIAFVLLGTALSTVLLQIEGSGKLWLIGLCVLFAGGYFLYGATGVSLWSNLVIANTTILGICMMLYMLCICALITSLLKDSLRKIGFGTVVFLGAACTALAILCIVTDIRFYDPWLWWSIIQSVVNFVLLVCLALNFSGASKNILVCNIGASIVLLGFGADFAGTAFGWWQGGLISQFVFMILLIVSIVLVFQIIPRNINAARKTKEMEAEQKEIRAQLQESRIAIMISQIQPHFIYTPWVRSSIYAKKIRIWQPNWSITSACICGVISASLITLYPSASPKSWSMCVAIQTSNWYVFRICPCIMIFKQKISCCRRLACSRWWKMPSSMA